MTYQPDPRPAPVSTTDDEPEGPRTQPAEATAQVATESAVRSTNPRQVKKTGQFSASDDCCPGSGATILYGRRFHCATCGTSGDVVDGRVPRHGGRNP